MQEIKVAIPLEPTPKGRPRFVKSRYGMTPYTPPKTKRFEQDVALYYIQSDAPKFEKGTPISVSIEFGIAVPKSTTKKRKIAMLQGTEHHVIKPDLDNLTKAVLDGLNNIAWHDDAQITELHVKKLYTEKPYIQLHIKDNT